MACSNYCDEQSTAIVTVNNSSTFKIPGIAEICVYPPGEYNPEGYGDDPSLNCQPPRCNRFTTTSNWVYAIDWTTFPPTGLTGLTYEMEARPGLVDINNYTVRPNAGLSQPSVIVHLANVGDFIYLTPAGTPFAAAGEKVCSVGGPYFGVARILQGQPLEQNTCPPLSPVWPGQNPPRPDWWTLEISSSTWNFKVSLQFPVQPSVNVECLGCLPCKGEIEARLRGIEMSLGGR